MFPQSFLLKWNKKAYKNIEQLPRYEKNISRFYIGRENEKYVHKDPSAPLEKSDKDDL